MVIGLKSGENKMVKRAYYRFVPIWFDTETCEVEVRQLWLQPILNFVLWMDIKVLGIKEFKILVEKDVVKGN